jgi:transcriptional regulator with XRE-family HTH domain
MNTRNIANGAAIRAIREARGITLRGLATETGYNAGHLSRVERGLHGGSELFVREVARALGVADSALTKAAA